ncbi:MAG: M20/M25/M40 family metallo-hydrolase, partial [Pyramidobacter sp.]|nr:M20/M25/M40 family metallo-hydrolase [Pyramidobacter sp.]
MNSTISQDRLERMIERRRDFHRYPESGWCEFRTTARIAQIMDSLGYEVQLADAFLKPENVMGRNVDADKEKARALREGADKEWLNRITACTGLTAELKTGIEGPVVAMRFDIDCVDTQETDNAEHLPVKLGFRSENPGWMHACGHDGHMSLGLAVAEYVAEHKDSFRG